MYRAYEIVRVFFKVHECIRFLAIIFVRDIAGFSYFLHANMLPDVFDLLFSITNNNMGSINRCKNRTETVRSNVVIFWAILTVYFLLKCIKYNRIFKKIFTVYNCFFLLMYGSSFLSELLSNFDF